MFRAVHIPLHRGFDLHVDAAGLTPAHGVQMELTRSRVATDGAPGASTADVALSEAKRRQKLPHRTGLAANVDTADRLHFPWAAGETGPHDEGPRASWC